MKIQRVTDVTFSPYGKVLTGYDTEEILKVMQSTPCPEDDTIYVPSAKELEVKHQDGEDKLITAKNKWLIAHEDAKIAGAFCGLKGENITL